MSIPTSQSFTAGLLYYCAFTPFPIELFEAPGIADENGDPATAFLRSGYMAADEWWLVDRTETRAEFVGHGSERDFYETAIVDRADDGRWESNNFGSCHPHSLLQGRGGVDRVTWWIREADWPRPSDRTLKIRARDLCPQGLADRVHATIRYGDDRIIMILATDPGIAAPNSCDHPEAGDAQVTTLSVALAEAVGNRTLWDLSDWPGRDAHIPSQRLLVCCG